MEVILFPKEILMNFCGEKEDLSIESLVEGSGATLGRHETSVKIVGTNSTISVEGSRTIMWSSML